MTTSKTSTSATIATFNDRFRRRQGAGWMITSGVQQLGPVFVLMATNAVSAFEAFTNGNDPYGERDFGSFELAGQLLLWKIDYFDQNLQFASPDPADASVTRRMLILMLASEH